jgi:oligopeptide/dipeptide ABC transporter ATP-binding protein
VSQQIRPLIARAERISRRTAHGRVVSVLATAGLKDPERVARSYPHELSGGMAQRVAIALALACRPKVLIADEPGTGLDAIVRAEVMESMRTAVRREVGCAIIISHDMALISQLCDRIVVMYGGEVMEMGETRMLLEAPLHPYTQALLSVSRIPSPGDPYPTIPGTIPDVFTQTAGCPFCPRCISRMAVCETVPLHDVVRSGRVVRCHLYPEADHADNR